MAAPKIQPLHLGKPGAEFLLHHRHRFYQGGGVLLAQGMEMKPLNPVQQIGAEFFQGDSQPGAGRTGIVNSVILGGVRCV